MGAGCAKGGKLARTRGGTPEGGEGEALGIAGRGKKKFLPAPHKNVWSEKEKNTKVVTEKQGEGGTYR